MKYSSIIFFILLISFSACKKDKDRKKGFCYCEFANGNNQEYDLNHLSRIDQQKECDRHNNNAAQFGGVCTLE